MAGQAFVFLDRDVVLAIHEEQLAQHGGGVGVRDVGWLDSALARPVNRLMYEHDVDCASLAADYAFGLVKNHPFIDGNKRTAFVAMVLALMLNSFQLIASDEDALMAMLQLADGTMDEAAFAEWIRGNMVSMPNAGSAPGLI